MTLRLDVAASNVHLRVTAWIGDVRGESHERKHGLKEVIGISNQSRKPSDAELGQARVAVEHAYGLRFSGARAPVADRDLVKRMSAVGVAALSAACDVPDTPRSPPRMSRPACATGMAKDLKVGSSFGRLLCLSDRWSLETNLFTVSAGKRSSSAFLKSPTTQDLDHAAELLRRLLPTSGRVDPEKARELLQLVLVRLALIQPPQLSLQAFLSEPPSNLWFTVDVGVDTRRFTQAMLLDESLLDESHWLELNELNAMVARAMLGADVASVIATLRAAATPLGLVVVAFEPSVM